MPMISPPAKPSIIGNGKPGKIPLFSSMNNVMIDPAMMPTIEIKVGRSPRGKVAELMNLKNMAPVIME